MDVGDYSAATVSMEARKARKRKQLQQQQPPILTQPNTCEAFTQPAKEDPYPTHLRPTAEECLAVRDDLLALHGFPQEFAKYRKLRQRASSGNAELEPLEKEDEDEDATETVLDGLVRTVLSQNTTDANSLRAFVSLKSAFPTWEDVSFNLY